MLSFLMAAICSLTTVACADDMKDRSTAEAINAANQLLRNDRVDDALHAYLALAPMVPHSEELTFNLGIAEYRAGKLEAAEERFRGLLMSSNPDVGSGSRYNLGNCLYAKALQTAEQDSTAAIALLKDAIRQYRSALKLDDSLADARANIELAAELIRQLNDQQNQQKDSSQQQDSNSRNDQSEKDQQQDQPSADESKQQPSSDSEQNNSSSQDQPSSSEMSDTEKSEKPEAGSSADDSSESSRNSNSAASESENKSNEQKPDSQPGEQESADTTQSESSPAPRKSDSNPGAEPEPHQQHQGSSNDRSDDAAQSSDSGDEQQPPSENDSDRKDGRLTAANDSAGDRSQQGSAAVRADHDPDSLMTREEALKLLQAVRDRDMIRRLKQQRQERSRRIPVDRDW
ncbi:MAG: hypothetical protein R3C49_20215 [Planctomycetaceae bacterium]